MVYRDTLIIDLYQVPHQASPREIGIEVEMEGSLLPTRVSYWNVGGDGSLRGESVEYALKLPCMRRLVKSRVDVLYNSFGKISPSERCGTHIHVNCQQLTSRQVFSFICLYFFFEGLLTKWCGEDREGNLFCLRAEDAEGIIVSLIEDKMNRGYPHKACRHYLKYGAINIAALMKFGSLEFRALRTPTSNERILKWVKMLLSLKDLSKDEANVEECMMNFSVHGAKSLVQKVFGDNASELVRCCKSEAELDMIVSDGIRRTQTLVYVPFREEG